MAILANTMEYQKTLITGGAGFVGSNLAIKLKENYPHIKIIVLDNLKRRGSELNIGRLKQHGVEFVHGDIRNKEDLEIEDIDLILDCSAEPSVLAGVGGSPQYLINTNLVGTINCLELARKNGADVVFLSTSRVYPIKELNQLNYKETDTRFELLDDQGIVGASKKGIREDFPLGEVRSMYGATKLCSEFILQEYIATYKVRGIINRCGVITGPWQMGKVDQGVIVLWLARHVWANKPLSYIGYGGRGKQVRDFIHIDDLFEVLKIQLEGFDKFDSEIYNIGGGLENSLSLFEITKLCQEITGNKIQIGSISEDRPNDVRIYISDCSKFKNLSRWQCQKSAEQTFTEIYQWIVEYKNELEKILN